jgi:hypothetical protein
MVSEVFKNTLAYYATPLAYLKHSPQGVYSQDILKYVVIKVLEIIRFEFCMNFFNLVINLATSKKWAFFSNLLVTLITDVLKYKDTQYKDKMSVHMLNVLMLGLL